MVKTYVEKIKEGINDLVDNGDLVDEGLVISSKFHSELDQNGKSIERTVVDDKIRT